MLISKLSSNFFVTFILFFVIFMGYFLVIVGEIFGKLFLLALWLNFESLCLSVYPFRYLKIISLSSSAHQYFLNYLFLFFWRCVNFLSSHPETCCKPVFFHLKSSHGFDGNLEEKVCPFPKHLVWETILKCFDPALIN